MLDSSTDANSNIEIGGNDFASLTNLHVVGDVASINGGAGSTNCAILGAHDFS